MNSLSKLALAALLAYTVMGKRNKKSKKGQSKMFDQDVAYYEAECDFTNSGYGHYGSV